MPSRTRFALCSAWFFVLLAMGTPASAIMARDYTQTFRRNAESVQRCFDAARERAPNLSGGELALLLSVTGRGVATGRVLSASDGMQPVADCVLDLATGWRFAPSTTGGSRTFALVFRAQAAFTIRDTTRGSWRSGILPDR